MSRQPELVVIIAAFAQNGLHSVELSALADIMLEASRLVGGSAYEVRIVAETPDPIETAAGLRILPDLTLAEADGPFDTLVVVGVIGIPPAPTEAVAQWLRQTAPRCRRYGAVCTGAFTLGAVGLLDGKEVTTHWQFADDLARSYPEARVLPDRIFVRDGPLFTSAGVTAAFDIALALIEEDFGRSLALAVARRMVMFLKRPGGQSQFSPQLAGQIATKGQIQRAMDLIHENPASPLSVGDLARHVGMSDRNFSRVFVEQIGDTPAAFVEAARIDLARRLLEETRLPAQTVATRSGFLSVASLRRAFHRRLGLTPREYRDRFQTSGDGTRAVK